jgi:hypothetical protein
MTGRTFPSLVTLGDPTRLMRSIKFFSVILSLGLGAAGVFGMISISPSQIITAFYVACFGTMLFIFEMHVRRFEMFVILNFGFMTSWRGRAFFSLFCGSLAVGLGIIGIIVGCLSVFNGLFNLYVYYKRPDIRAQLEGDAAKYVQNGRVGIVQCCARSERLQRHACWF